MFTRSGRLRAVLTLAATLAAPLPAAAADDLAECGDPPPAWQAFAAFGDPADYWVSPGGDFESGAAGWSLDNAHVEDGNDDLDVLAGEHSLALGGGLLSLSSTAVSPWFCVTPEHPTFRYTLKAKGAVGSLSTFVRYRAADGSTQEEQVHSRTATTLLPGQWKPSDLQPLATDLPMAELGGVVKVRLVFRTGLTVNGAGYQIDNVLVDPYRTR